ncbi:MAG TPA: MOSC domain-containing protein [Rhodobacterales bacterium]|nr:MOSC domain-containing protein [Rhodobacterales bacterium]
MPALTKTPYSARVEWLGFLPERADGLRSQAVRRVSLGFEGIEGDGHGGLVRPSCGRVTQLYPRDTEIRNTRQVSIICQQELARIGAAIGVRDLRPALLGANILVSGLPDFSHLPPAARLLAENGACLTIDVQNRPCVLPGRDIEALYPGKGKAFKDAARGLRGVTAWVERPGALAVGDHLHLFVPDQRPWQGNADE